MKLSALWQRTPIAGWANMLRFVGRGVRLHPGARVYGAARALNIGRGSKIGGGCVFNLGPKAEIRLGHNIWAYRDVEFHTEGQIEIGAGTSFQRAVLINGNVSVGRGCIFAPGVFISSGKHVYDLRPAWPIRSQEALLATAQADPDVARYVLDRPVWIDEDCWLGAHVVVAPGVRIGRGAVIGANSVVTRDVEPYAIVAGAPAKPVNQRLAWRPQPVLDATSPEARPYLYAGFDVEEKNHELIANVGGKAIVALEATTQRVLEVRLLAEAKGTLACHGRSQSFGMGEQTLRLPDCEGTKIFDHATLVALEFNCEQRAARVRLLRCGFVE
jgi:acetyltransferase-like isoleucine patch superfamily enzyme